MRTGQIGLLPMLILVVLMVGVVAAIIYVERGQRRITVQYAKRVVGRRQYGGTSTHIPLKVNTGGVIPVIFAARFWRSRRRWPACSRPGGWGDAVVRQLDLRHAALQPAVRGRDPVLRVLLHGDHLQSG